MTSPTEQSENTPQIAQILQFLQDPMEVPQLYLSYCGKCNVSFYLNTGNKLTVQRSYPGKAIAYLRALSCLLSFSAPVLFDITLIE